MPTTDAVRRISISDASKLGVLALVREVEQGREHVIVRDDKPVAVVMSTERYERLQQLQDDLIDITLVASRMMTSSGQRYSLDDVLDHFGYSRDELAKLPD